jgi:sulfate transport system substrate-binding protein
VKRFGFIAGAAVASVLVLAGLGASAGAEKSAKVELLNASYDVSRELFAQINPAFIAQWKSQTGQTVTIRQSHGGSSKQARAVAEGMRADVVTFNQVTDIDFLQKSRQVAPEWRKRYPGEASPYYSLPVFLVRGGNPKHIKDWNDLARPDVKVVFPNPKTSGNGRYSYLAAYAYALQKNAGDQVKAQQFVQQVLKNVPVFDTGGRGATTTFIERQIGDVLITFESEVNAIRREYARNPFDTVVPSVSIRADFPVAVVDRVVDRQGSRKVATAYLQFLYSDAGQEILAKNFYRVRNGAIAGRYKAQFPEVRLVSIEEAFGGWDQVMKVHFGDGGFLDQAIVANR